jgi:hypothetical protein
MYRTTRDLTAEASFGAAQDRLRARRKEFSNIKYSELRDLCVSV